MFTSFSGSLVSRIPGAVQTSKKTGFPLPAGNHLPGVFGWSGYSCLVISKIIAINSGKLIV
ncbi:hypothetical protein U9242_24675, partial [Escherichia coli]